LDAVELSITDKGGFMSHRFHSLQGISDGKYREARRLRREMTVAETQLWLRLRGNKVNGFHFRRQHVILGFIVDFYCHKAKVIIEVDGGIHKKRTESDRKRDAVLRSRGLTLIRFPNQRVMDDLDRVAREIMDACKVRIH
jgi:very-short-patch-repair endonuclease